LKDNNDIVSKTKMKEIVASVNPINGAAGCYCILILLTTKSAIIKEAPGDMLMIS